MWTQDTTAPLLYVAFTSLLRRGASAPHVLTLAYQSDHVAISLEITLQIR